MSLSIEIIDYIADEVWRQQDGPLHVAHLCRAWEHALQASKHQRPLSHKLIQEWGRLVEPDENRQGYRMHRIRVGRSNGTEPWLIHAEMDGLIRSITNYTPEAAYKRFEEIHPFADGNGRTGKVIFNFLKGTLRKPVMPPNFFACSNP